LFVKRINNYFMVEEDVYETAHLEILPPRQRSAVKDLSSQDADGLWRITCLNTKNTILLYNDEQYWNRKLKTEFLSSVFLALCRNSTSGTRATTATIAKSQLSRRPGGERKCSILLTKKLSQANDPYNQSTKLLANIVTVQISGAVHSQ
jgi:hypothetical protein